MKKQILSEEFKRMQKLAGIKENKINDKGIDLLDYDRTDYTPESIKKAINMNDESILDNNGVYVETSSFVEALYKYINDAGYSFPETVWDSIEEEAYYGDLGAIYDLNDLKMFNNFTQKDAIKIGEDFIRHIVEDDMNHELGLSLDIYSIEDFKK